MSTLFAFGDSFAQNLPGNWIDRLAKLRNLEVKNYAVGGSCLEYSFIKILDAIDQIKENDIVIFVLTHPERLDLEDQIKGNISSAYKIQFKKTVGDLEDSLFYIKYQMKRSKDILKNKHLLHLSFIKSLTLYKPKTKFLVIPAFREVQNSFFISNTENFLFANNLYLTEISDYEWNYLKIKGEAFQDIFGLDPRTNHLSNPNLDELAQTINEIIDTWDLRKFNKKRFKKNIISHPVSTVEDFFSYYVDTGLIDKERFDSLMPNKTKKKKWFLF